MIEVTVITVSKELTSGLIATLRSVQNQETNFKHILIDGSHNLELEEYVSQHFPQVRVERQKANGIYSAMNYGISKVPDTDNVIFLNASDFFLGASRLARLNEIAQADRTWAYGGVISFSPDDSYSRILGLENFSGKAFIRGQVLIPHPSTIIPVLWIKELGGFNEKFSIVADIELAYRIFKKYGPPKHFKNLVSGHEIGGVSTTNLSRQTREIRVARLINFPIATFTSISRKLFFPARPGIELELNGYRVANDAALHYKSCQKNLNFPNCCREKLLKLGSI